jgi:hypothetical protein
MSEGGLLATPSEDAVARYELRRKRRRRRRIVFLVVDVVVIVAVVAVVRLYQDTNRMRDRARAQAERFTEPEDWGRVGAVQEGSNWCVLACESPRSTAVYRAYLTTPAEACATLRAEVERQIGPTTTPAHPNGGGRGWCEWQAKAPAIGSHAFVVAGAGDPNTLQRTGPTWTRELRPGGDGILVWLQFDSGIR